MIVHFLCYISKYVLAYLSWCSQHSNSRGSSSSDLDWGRNWTTYTSFLYRGREMTRIWQGVGMLSKYCKPACLCWVQGTRSFSFIKAAFTAWKSVTLLYLQSQINCRTSQDLEAANHGAILASTLWRLPLIYLAMFIARFVLTTMFRPMFKIFLGDMGWKETTFATAAGLRGSVSLILAQAVVTDEQAATNDKNRVSPQL